MFFDFYSYADSSVYAGALKGYKLAIHSVKRIIWDAKYTVEKKVVSDGIIYWMVYFLRNIITFNHNHTTFLSSYC